jgi:hypothetical protein
MTFTLATVQDLFYLVAAVCLVWITVFLCWALFEIGRLGKQANDVVSDTREKIGRVEDAASNLVEKLTSVSSYVGLIAEWGKQLAGYVGEHKEEGRRGKKKLAKLSEMED